MTTVLPWIPLVQETPPQNLEIIIWVTDLNGNPSGLYTGYLDDKGTWYRFTDLFSSSGPWIPLHQDYRVTHWAHITPPAPPPVDQAS